MGWFTRGSHAADKGGKEPRVPRGLRGRHAKTKGRPGKHQSKANTPKPGKGGAADGLDRWG